MTLGQFFELVTLHPTLLVGFYVMVPLTALLAGILGRGEGHLVPWNWLYSVLVYFAAIPGVFALVLTLYFWLFERRPLMDTNIYTQILPIISMAVTLWLIRWNTPLERIPGFGKLSGLLMMIFVVLLLMWILDRTRIILFTWIPFFYVLLILAGLLMIFRMGWVRIFERKNV